MSASSQGYPRPAIPVKPLTITEVKIEPARGIGISNIYYYAAAGTGFGLLAGVVFATTAWNLHWKSTPQGPAKPANAAAIASGPRGPRDFGSVSAIASGLKGHLTTDWQEKPSYRLVIEPSDPARQGEFALAVTGSTRPLSVAFQLVDSTGNALCGQDVVVRFDAARAALNAPAATNGAARNEPMQAALDQLRAKELARENGRDIFDNEIGDDGQIAALNAQGQMPCSAQAYQNAASWTLAPDFPSVAEQGELVKQQTESTASQKVAPARKTSAGKKPEVHKVTASLDGFVAPSAAGR